MLIAILVYLSIGCILVFGVLREKVFELVRENSLAIKIICLVLFVLETPAVYVYGFVKAALKKLKVR